MFTESTATESAGGEKAIKTCGAKRTDAACAETRSKHELQPFYMLINPLLENFMLAKQKPNKRYPHSGDDRKDKKQEGQIVKF